MIDFIEYVVAELKSKRLSKTNAVALVRQLGLRSSSSGGAGVLHPLLHRNTSDLSEQRYSSTFTGEEFFLADHQVKRDGGAGQKVLPGVAYLEMARAAIEDAWPARPAATVLELHHTVWARPIGVRESQHVSIALLAQDADEIDYEIYSQEAEQEVVHCQGRAVWGREPAPAALDLAQLQGQLGQDSWESSRVYAACARMGLIYGPSFQAITALHRGHDQVLAQLRVPGTVADPSAGYVLHPSVMDGALQAAVGLIDEGAVGASQPRVPFALDLVRIVSPCTAEMVAWVRYARGSQATDPVVKLDIDLCDAGGQVCVQMHGFSWRALASEVSRPAADGRAIGRLLAAPVWHASGVEASAGAGPIEYAAHHVVLCELSPVQVERLGARLPDSQCVALQAGQAQSLAQRYSDHALACFERIQGILRGKPHGKVLVQLVVADQPEQALLAGLSGLLKTAALENPQLIGQVILVPADLTGEALGRYLGDEQRGGGEALIRYTHGGRQVWRWQEVAADPAPPPIAFQDPGVYLITGGLGALGRVFTQEILARTREARVVLTGRSALTAATQAVVDALSPVGGRVRYRPVDLGDLEAVRRLMAAIQDEDGPLRGILHSAGMIADQFILKKAGAQFREVLAPKVTGTFNLDAASQAVALDFFVLFSSLAGATGNVGQADYATANGFLDQFAAYRNRQVAAHERHGRTRSINWPLWQGGGMGLDPGTQERLRQSTGMRPMQTATGLDAFYRSLAGPADQVLVVEGDLPALRRTLLGGRAGADGLAELGGPAGVSEPPAAEPGGGAGIEAEDLAEQTQAYLRRQLSELLKLPVQQIDPRAALEQYGMDSILAMKLTTQLEQTFGSLSKTLFFEYQTIHEVAEYFLAHHATPLTALLAPRANRASEAVVLAAPAAAPRSARRGSSQRVGRRRRAAPRAPAEGDRIAIIGLSGRYPEAVDLDAYWQNLREGKDCIVEVPKARWDWEAYFSRDRSQSGRHYSKWGGFIAGVDEFDPLFFNIAPVEAERLDPQERLFLQHAWMAIEDAGYTRAGLQGPLTQDLGGQVGVYVGVMYSEYQLFGAEASVHGKRLAIAGSAASIANRVSYALNLHGPSLTLDTMCSSSLTAIHFACEDLKHGRTTLAIAGGVNVSIHPNKYLVLSAGQFISSDGHCQSFGEGGDGYIPGEGVGAVVLKRFSEAKRDGDHIYGIIRGSALTHGGKTNGYTVPNPHAQASAIRRALAESQTDARHISYIEAHGTGTTLGDPIEIAALSHAFQHDTPDTAFCLIGSVKSNIGHCESAAGIAGLTKVLLQMQHQQIVASLHSTRLNPHIDFESSPFVVNHALRPWEPPVIEGRTLPRIAGLSSFGAGGSNAHLIVEEYETPAPRSLALASVVIVLSARTPAQLQQKAGDLLAFVRRRDTVDLVAMAYTLQVGREAMDERLGFVVSSVAQLTDRLQAYVAGAPGIEDAYQGRVTRHDAALSLFNTDVDLQQTIDKWVARGKVSRLLELWVKGVEVEWRKLYGEDLPPRISLPTYPFARERCWITPAAGGPVAASGGAAAGVLHPLLHRNTSDLSEQRYSSTFTGEEFFLADHQVKRDGGAGQKVLPGVAYLEMARAAIEDAWPARPAATVLELHHTVWARPIGVRESQHVSIALLAQDADEIDYEIYSQEAEQEVVHCQGRAVWGREPAPAALDLAQLQGQLGQDSWESSRVYAACARMGLIYGPSFQAITALHRGHDQVLAQLRVPGTVADPSAGYVLHPSVMDGALQAAVGLIDEGAVGASQPRVPFALDLVRIVSPCTAEMVAWVRYARGSQATDPVVKLDIDLCDAGGQVCVQMHGFSWRALASEVSRPTGVSEPPAAEPGGGAGIEAEDLAEQTQAYLRRQLSELLKLPVQQIDPRAALEQYGMDSILAMKLTTQLEQTFGSLSKTLFFEYQTIHEVAEYFLAHHATPLTALLAPRANRASEAVVLAAPAAAPRSARRGSSQRVGRRRRAAPRAPAEGDRIAIIGLSGRYPEAVDLDAYWQNLREGKDCIVEVPKARWDWEAYFSRDRSQSGRHYSKWGGFIAGVDEFDPLFFNIAPVEAERLDPQERLFLQHAWMAIEDAGYTRAGLQGPLTQDLGGQVGVYVGVMYSEYQLFGAEASVHGKRLAIAGSAASIANRVSYALNLHGPSLTLDTMCSSSLTAIHFACEDLKHGRTTLAIAGGVNVSIHPNKYLVLSAGQFISSDGHCQSFGEGGDGYIPGEGVGAVVLKRFSEAKRDGDHIYGIIRGSALTHGGKTNGYTVPNPHAQASAIRRALAESQTDARHISYIEAHGTGTTLGDPIEIAALSHAFQHDTPDTAFCLIGSVKSNIGHCESAAGIAGLTKVLLQMQHQQIVASLHSTRLNPHIDFESSPFVVNHALRPWEPPVIEGRTLPRIAGLSSFGAGGSNAHLIVEEYETPAPRSLALASVVIVLSARTPAQLQQKAGDLLAFVRRRDTVDLVAMAYTLQVGREAMDERLGFVVSSVAQLTDRLQAYVAGAPGIEDAYQGRVTRHDAALSLFNTDVDLQQTIDKWVARGKVSRLLELWVKGVEVEWRKLYGEDLPPRISLPTYPFARERCWITPAAGGPVAASGGAAAGVLHPLLHRNTSDLSEQRYSSTFTGEEFFLADHQVKRDGGAGQKVLPGVAYLEMARAAIEDAWPARPAATVLELHHTVWARPIGVRESQHVSIALLAQDADEIDYEIYSQEAEQEVVHCQGRAVWGREPAPAALDLAQLQGQLGQDSWESSRVYAACARMGLIYGPSFQAITALHRGHDQVLAQLRVPGTVADPSAGYVLHPSVMDGALQAAVGLIDEGAVGASQPRVPFALDLVRIVSPCTAEMVAWVRYARGSQATDPVVKLDIDLCDAGGQVCVQMHGFSWRALASEVSRPAADGRAIGRLLAAPVWHASGVEASAGAGPIEYAAHHVVLCELSPVQVERLGARLPDSQCVALQAGQAQSLAQRYSDHALACFERIQGILRGKPHGKVLVQLVVADQPEQALLAGLSGLLKTAALENPQLIGQVILVPADLTGEALGRYLGDEQRGGGEALIRYTHGGRQVWRWQEVAADPAPPPIAFQDPGVYLITGGLGALGRVFTQEILARTREARVVLTGRSALTAATQAVVDALSPVGGRVRYRPVDLGDLEAVRRLMAAIQDEDGPLRGILHSAGMIADQFILKKAGAQFREVLAPKVTGTFNLDAASQAVALDFFVLFSSLAGATGNVGQADYATANGFLDQFAAYRNRQVAAHERHGRTRSINWPLWQGGGMGLDPGTQERLRQSTGMRPMQTATGLDAFYRSLAGPADQVLVVEGDLPALRRTLLGGRAGADGLAELGGPAGVSEPPAAEPGGGAGIEAEDLAEQTQAYLRRQLSELLKLPVQQIDPRAALEQYGMDSILAMKLTTQLEQTFGSLSKTLFFEYQTITGLAGYFVRAYPAIVRDTFGLLRKEAKAVDADHGAIPTVRALSTRRSKPRFPDSATHHQKDIAIIGLAGRYPQAENLDEFWRNLQSGRDCITEIPSDRWDHSLYYDPDQSKSGKSYSKWGGFIADVDKFDPLFFNISPKEAALIDPQERLFLETVWHTIEDAGYDKESLSASRVGVFVGVMWGHYELFGAQSILRGTTLPGSSHASIANRVSYLFDFHGPSIALDTMCSSSLTAIHLACEELRKGEIDAAIAGGVNLTVHPYKYLSLSQGRFAASDGRCRSFGKGGDGYVPGEGVGAVLLKPLATALRDGDQVYAVVKSSAVNHGGKTNGYTVPNPNAQAAVILDALAKAGIDPRTLSYIEAHGTGTSLGDPIEITGLLKAFEGSTEEKQFCPIGSVKSNIGHLEAAAGIAAVTKALLQIRHKQLVPSLHADPLNPHIDFRESPFYVQTALTEWKHAAAHPRRVGVSSFGAGGSNAHLILEEYADARKPQAASHVMPRQAFLLSARDPDALCRYAEKVVSFLADVSDVSLADMAYTSQVGRAPMDARLVCITSSAEDLRGKLDRWTALRRNTHIDAGAAVPETDDVFYGNLKETQYSAGNLIEGQAARVFLADLLANRDLEKLARFWVLGVDIDWSHIHQHPRPRRVSLPAYPFARERCWVDPDARVAGVVQEGMLDTGQQSTPETPGSEGADPTTILEKTEAYLKALIGEEIKLASDRIGSSDRLESFGIDSVMINRLNVNLERDLGALPKTLLYEYETVREIATFLLQEAREAVIGFLGYRDSTGGSAAPSMVIEEEARRDEPPAAGRHDDLEPIAIVGIHGYYPHSADLDEYWENLKYGRDLIDLVPPERWDSGALYHPDPTASSEGKIYCKWGGFLDDCDKFDPQFFNISTEEARVMDPQERLFLESVWAAIEDAGYTRDSLKARFPKARSADVGVFVGVTTNSYHMLAPDGPGLGGSACPTALPWSIANRVSYVFDFNGPSMPVDTACSSSLVAVHLACESLRNRGCQVAIAGGVNLYLHPSKYQSLCQRRMLSLHGSCHSYGAGGDGFVPGEGVGTLVLKRLSAAMRDHDHIHAVIAGSAFDHSGRSNGYSAPNPTAQAHLIGRTLEQAGIHPESIGYVEGHGTGTELGDGLEIAALTQAFQKQTTRTQFCPVGSVKANVGHSESAAGIAGLAKVILQIRHRQLVPSIHSDQASPIIEFKESPFYLQHELSEWKSSPDQPRRALINSFGAGGVNACVILEEHETASSLEESQGHGPQVFTLSARNEERLREYVDRLLVRLKRGDNLDLPSLCYTLQVGREAMEERLAVVVSDISELIDRLVDWRTRGSSADVHRGRPGAGRGSGRSATSARTAAGASPGEIASMWVAGEEVDWDSGYPLSTPRRIGLPTYPFARERYWITDSPIPATRPPSRAELHPLITYNSSTLKEISFSSSLLETAFYAIDHRVNGVRIFPAACLLEMACVAGSIAGEQRVRQIKDLVWIQPVIFRTGSPTLRTSLKEIGDSVEYAMSSMDDDNEAIVHSEGRLVFGNGRPDRAGGEDRLPIRALKTQCARSQPGAAYYSELRKRGLDYGPTFQTIQEIYLDRNHALSRLKIADQSKGEFDQFILHPSLIDGALQTVAGLLGGLESGTPHVPFALDEVELVQPVPQTCYAYAECADLRGQDRGGVGRFNIRLLNESGEVLIRIKNLYVRPLAKPLMGGDSPGAELAATGRLPVAAGERAG